MSGGGRAAVVLGLGINGLGVVRALGRAGIRVIGVATSASEVGLFSRFGRAVRLEPASTPQQLRALLQVVRREAQAPVVIPTTDAFAQLVADHQAELAPHCRFLAPDAALLRRINTKDGLIDVLAEHAVPAPPSARCTSLAELRAQAGQMRFPVLVKPADTFARPLPTGEKNVFFAERRALLDWAGAYAHGLSNMVFQEVIESGDGHIWLCGLLLDARSQPVLCASIRKVRQYLPDYGITSLGVTAPNPEIEAISKRLMTGLGYRGICTLEFARDRRTGRHLLIEINPRTTYPNQLFTDAGVDFAQGLYRLLCGEQVAAQEARPGLVWIDFARDLGSFKQKRAAGKLTLAGWLATVAAARSFAVFAADDLEPHLVESLAFVKNLGRQLLRALGISAGVPAPAPVPAFNSLEPTPLRDPAFSGPERNRAVAAPSPELAARNLVLPVAAPELASRNEALPALPPAPSPTEEAEASAAPSAEPALPAQE